MAIIAALVPLQHAARSFWCGLLGAPVFLSIGALCVAIAFATPNG